MSGLAPAILSKSEHDVTLTPRTVPASAILQPHALLSFAKHNPNPKDLVTVGDLWMEEGKTYLLYRPSRSTLAACPALVVWYNWVVVSPCPRAGSSINYYTSNRIAVPWPLAMAESLSSRTMSR